MSDPVHALDPDRVLVVVLPEPGDRRDAEEVHDRQQHERKGHETVAEVRRLTDERECDHGAQSAAMKIEARLIASV